MVVAVVLVDYNASVRRCPFRMIEGAYLLSCKVCTPLTQSSSLIGVGACVVAGAEFRTLERSMSVSGDVTVKCLQNAANYLSQIKNERMRGRQESEQQRGSHLLCSSEGSLPRAAPPRKAITVTSAEPGQKVRRQALQP